MKTIQDPEIQALATCSQDLQPQYKKQSDTLWKDSPFNWIRIRSSSRQKGAIGEKLVSQYLQNKGFNISRSPDSEADRVVSGQRVEIKTSMLWENGSYKFQQLRDQNYRFVICLGLSPFDAHCWVIPKREILLQWKNGNITSQHGGATGTDTAWLTVNPSNVPQWLNQWGKTATGRQPYHQIYQLSLMEKRSAEEFSHLQEACAGRLLRKSLSGKYLKHRISESHQYPEAFHLVPYYSLRSGPDVCHI